MPFLSVNPDVLLSPVADGYVAYHTTAEQLHELNPTAALLVELCDGRRDVSELLTVAGPLLPPDSESAVTAWIKFAIESGVLVETKTIANRTELQELPADQLSDLADRLRSEGKVQAAFLCQQRAAELEPDDSSHWRSLGELAHIVGRRQEAREAYEQYLTHCPDDAEIQHLLTSLRDEAAPSRVPDECIRQLYKRFSEFYETNMCDELGYSGPEQLNVAIEDLIQDRNELSILDLGCGTGLAGPLLRPRAARLIGIDLSPEMIAQAKARSVYDELHVAEITEFLRDTTETFDLIVACDALIYFGDLSEVIASALKRLKTDGLIAFSVEAGSQPPWTLTDSGRYVHHVDHILQIAEQLGLQSAYHEAFLRMEYGNEVTAIYTTLKRP